MEQTVLVDHTPIVVLDDDEGLCDAVKTLLNHHGIANVSTFTEPHAMLEAMNDGVRICIVDYSLKSDITGLDVIKQIVNTHKHVFFIMLSGQQEMQVVVDYMNSVYGSRYIEKGSATCDVLIVYYVKDLLTYIDLLTVIYSTTNKLMKQTENLEKLINNEYLA
jgi:DNA-binding NtrC family response regulator